MPKFWVVMAVYRPNEIFFQRQLESLSAQTLADWQCILVDDSGDIHEQDRVMRYARADSRFVYERHPVRRGSVKAFETGLMQTPADVDYVCYCDQDDLWEAHKLMEVAAYLHRHDVALVHSDLRSIDADGNMIHPSIFHFERRCLDHRLLYLIVRNVVTGCTAAFRRTLLDHILPFPDLGNPPRYHHDLWTALHAAIHGGIGVIEEPLVRYRQHNANQIGAQVPPVFQTFPIATLLHPARGFRRSLERWHLHARLITDFMAAVSRCDRQDHCSEIAALDTWLHARFPPRSMLRLAHEMSSRRDPAMLVMQQLLVGKCLTGPLGSLLVTLDAGETV